MTEQKKSQLVQWGPVKNKARKWNSVVDNYYIYLTQVNEEKCTSKPSQFIQQATPIRFVIAAKKWLK